MGFIEKYCKENGEIVQVIGFSDGIDIASDYTADYDIIFVDMIMKHMDGLKTAEYIRSMDKKVVLAFVSAEPRFAVYGYAYEVTSFMLKPLSYSVFTREFSRCIEKVKSIQKKYIACSTENGMDRIEFEKIVFIESKGHKMIINTTEKSYCVYETMHGLESKLPKDRFSRCNRCYIVNLLHVKGVHGEYVLLDNAELKISRSRRKDFLNNMSQYFM